MSIDFIRPEVDELRPRISVIGVGGAGGNAIANMMGADVQGVEFIVANTDAQALNNSTADRRIQLGLKITQGLGAGSRPEISFGLDFTVPYSTPAYFKPLPSTTPQPSVSLPGSIPSTRIGIL